MKEGAIVLICLGALVVLVFSMFLVKNLWEYCKSIKSRKPRPDLESATSTVNNASITREKPNPTATVAVTTNPDRKKETDKYSHGSKYSKPKPTYLGGKNGGSFPKATSRGAGVSHYRGPSVGPNDDAIIRMIIIEDGDRDRGSEGVGCGTGTGNGNGDGGNSGVADQGQATQEQSQSISAGFPIIDVPSHSYDNSTTTAVDYTSTFTSSNDYSGVTSSSNDYSGGASTSNDYSGGASSSNDYGGSTSYDYGSSSAGADYSSSGGADYSSSAW